MQGQFEFRLGPPMRTLSLVLIMISNQIQVIIYNFHKGVQSWFLSGELNFSYGAQCTVCSIQGTACSFQQAPPQVGSALDLLKQPANQSQKYFSHMSFLLACCQCIELRLQIAIRRRTTISRVNFSRFGLLQIKISDNFFRP